MALMENEPEENPNPPPNWPKSIAQLILVILGVMLIVAVLSAVPDSARHLSRLPLNWIALAIIAVIVLLGWRSRARKPPSPPRPSPEQTGPRARPICGAISLAGAATGVSCFITAYIIGNFTHSTATFLFFALSLLSILPTLGFGILGLASGEHPKWPAAVGGLVGVSAILIIILAKNL